MSDNEPYRDGKRFKRNSAGRSCGDKSEAKGPGDEKKIIEEVSEEKADGETPEERMEGNSGAAARKAEEEKDAEEDKEAVTGEEKKTDEPATFNINVSLKDFRPDRNIFESSMVPRKPVKESGFLTMSVQRPTKPAKDEVKDVIFKAHATLHKFIEGWEDIGTGMLYVTRFADDRRCFFIRDGVMLTAFDFLAKYDLMPKKKKLGVTINVKEMAGDKIVGQIYCLVFRSEKAAEEFIDHIKV
jgi:hypothetical protein